MTRTTRDNRRRGAVFAAALALALALPLAGAGAALARPAGDQAASSLAADRQDVQLELPRPTGPYAIGRDTLHLVDRSRPDPWVPEAKGRELMVDLYYPARPGTGAPAAYTSTEEARLLLEFRGLDKVIPAEAVSGVRTHARTDARPMPGRHPLVVLSPGFTTSRYTLTLLAEELTSRGYVVAAMDHAYESVGTRFPGDRILTCVACEKSEETGLAPVAEGRAEDVSFLLDRLTGPRPAWRHAWSIDPRRIGMAGHSIGGNSAAQTMATDSRVRAGVNMDGTFFADVPAEGLDGRPFLMLGTDTLHHPGGQDQSWDRAWQRLDGWKRWLSVTDSGHFTFTDLPVLAEQLGLPDPEAPLSGTRSGEITRDYVSAFFDQQLRGIPQPLLDGPSAANPEVRFHTP
ncbi:alpha/beta hydrolase family protein [Streptomyces palmae]|uniref:Alpha/beta hydrolase n=1 Tax=Streptomyces palmae TaxID=1701085 RepID=A0A4Z0H8D9_9ACTN|nr:alpha/beta hydrolase [Streptomyces palmae]TGB12591.1 alpha/beta hydrolase [Streptomyces palmae]